MCCLNTLSCSRNYKKTPVRTVRTLIRTCVITHVRVRTCGLVYTSMKYIRTCMYTLPSLHNTLSSLRKSHLSHLLSYPNPVPRLLFLLTSYNSSPSPSCLTHSSPAYPAYPTYPAYPVQHLPLLLLFLFLFLLPRHTRYKHSSFPASPICYNNRHRSRRMDSGIIVHYAGQHWDTCRSCDDGAVVGCNYNYWAAELTTCST